MALITDQLAPFAAAVVVSEPPWQERAGFGAVVAEHARRHVSEVEVVADPKTALDRARALAHPEDLVVVAGSLYLVGAVLDVLEQAKATEPQLRPDGRDERHCGRMSKAQMHPPGWQHVVMATSWTAVGCCGTPTSALKWDGMPRTQPQPVSSLPFGRSRRPPVPDVWSPTP